MSFQILILFYSRGGHIAAMARQIARGVAQIAGATAILRTVPPLSPACEEPTLASVPDDGPPYVTLSDLEQCHGLVLGSPSYFGNMASPLKYFLETSSMLWASGGLAGKPAGLFTASSSLHGGQESTLISMMNPLLHHGMVMVGLPYTVPGLNETEAGGTPYGASYFTGPNNDREMTPHEKQFAQALGARVAKMAVRLAG